MRDASHEIALGGLGQMVPSSLPFLAPLTEASVHVEREDSVALVHGLIEGLFLLLGPAALHHAERPVHQVHLCNVEEPRRRRDDNVEVKW